MPRPKPDPDVLARALRVARHAADSAWLNGPREATTSERVSASVQAAVECLIGNGVIVVTDPATWPTWFSLDPPYDPDRPFPQSRSTT